MPKNNFFVAKRQKEWYFGHNLKPVPRSHPSNKGNIIVTFILTFGGGYSMSSDYEFLFEDCVFKIDYMNPSYMNKLLKRFEYAGAAAVKGSLYIRQSFDNQPSHLCLKSSHHSFPSQIAMLRNNSPIYKSIRDLRRPSFETVFSRISVDQKPLEINEWNWR